MKHKEQSSWDVQNGNKMLKMLMSQEKVTLCSNIFRSDFPLKYWKWKDFDEGLRRNKVANKYGTYQN